MFMRDLRRHKLDYSLLAFLALSFGIYFVLMRHSPARLFIATLGFAGSYWLWGIWHHLKGHHLTPAVVLEYFLVATCGVVIVSSLLL